MKIKFNWGTGIFIVLTIFILAVISFYIYITHLDINMVEDKYYEKELAYQQKIDMEKNTDALNGKISITKAPGLLMLRFPPLDPGSTPEGSVLFYRPSDPAKDFTLPIHLNDSLQQVFDISKIDPGRWMLKLDWKMGGKDYYYEEGVIIEH